MHYVNVLTGTWLMRVRSPQPGGGLVQACAVLLIIPVVDSFAHHGRPWFAVPVVVAMAAVHVALLLPAEPLTLMRPRFVALLANLLGIGLVAGLSIWLSRITAWPGRSALERPASAATFSARRGR